MINEGRIRFRTFSLRIEKRPVPNSYLICFAGGTDVDWQGWESPSGDRKKLEEAFCFMWNPFPAPSNKKGEYVVKFSSEERLKKFSTWLDNQIRLYGGVAED